MQVSSEKKARSPNGTLAIVTVSHMMQHIFLGTSILYPLIISDLKLDVAQFGLVVALSSLAGGLFQLIPSILSRRVARHFIYGVGNIILSVGTFLTGISQGILDFLGARILSNIGTAPTHPMGTAIISTKFKDEKIGWALGIHYGLAYLGNVIGPILMTFFAVTFNWRMSLFIFAVPSLIVGITMIWYLSEGKKMIQNREGVSTSLKSDVMAILKTRGVISILLAQAFITGAIDIALLTTYTPIFLSSALKLDTVGSGIYYTIELSGAILGPLVIGRIGAKHGYIRTGIISTAAGVTSVVLLSFYSSANLLLAVHLFLLGFFCFSFTTLAQSHLIQVTPRSSRDLVVGIYFTLLFSVGSLWTAVIGYIINFFSSFIPAFMFMGMLGLTGIIILVSQLKKISSKPNTT